MKNIPLAKKCSTCNAPIEKIDNTWRNAFLEKCVTPIGKITVPHIPENKF